MPYHLYTQIKCGKTSKHDPASFLAEAEGNKTSYGKSACEVSGIGFLPLAADGGFSLQVEAVLNHSLVFSFFTGL